MILIAGPCVIESKSSAFEIAENLKRIAERFNLDFTFKASFDKANRTSVESYRGPGLTKGLKILENIKKELKVKVLSDVHTPQQVNQAKEILDIIQIPAFLCRQTDLIIAAAKSKKTVNIKKGQFVSPYDVKYIIDKAISTGNKKIMLTERGSCFGYNNLVVDFRSFLIMKKFGYPVLFDVTHSLQRPSAQGGVSGGDREFAPDLAKAAVACGVDGLFIETHLNPKEAKSDKHTCLKLANIGFLIEKVVKIREAASG